MRSAFFRTLLELAGADPSVELVVGDLGFGSIEEFAGRYPDRFLNVGVAEQNMIGVATGLSMTGSTVFVYSIGNFPTLRCLEQVRNDICYHQANVKIVSVGGGFTYGQLGASHHATEDLAVVRVLPGIAVAAPGDGFESEAITREAGSMDGPLYLRLERDGAPVHDHVPNLPPGSSVRVVEGDDVAILVTGGLLHNAVEAAALLAERGVAARVVSMPWISPLDHASVLAAGSDTRLVVTVEEHSAIGGLGGAVAEVLAGETTTAPLLRLGLPSQFSCLVGDQDYLRQAHGLDPSSVADRILQRIGAQAGATAG